MKKTAQSGFTPVAILLALILVAVVGFAGYYVYTTQQNKKDETKLTPASQTATPAAPTTNDAQKYLVIKEWGVKGEVGDTPDLIYGISVEDSNRVGFSSTTLSKLDKSCGFNANGKMDVDYTAANTGVNRYAASQKDEVVNTMGGTVKEVGKLVNGYYYIQYPAQAACSDTAENNSKTQSEQQKVIKSASNFVDTIQSSN